VRSSFTISVERSYKAAALDDALMPAVVLLRLEASRSRISARMRRATRRPWLRELAKLPPPRQSTWSHQPSSWCCARHAGELPPPRPRLAELVAARFAPSDPALPPLVARSTAVDRRRRYRASPTVRGRPTTARGKQIKGNKFIERL
jgi:hypothetical protein